jgi:hypothetical protein
LPRKCPIFARNHCEASAVFFGNSVCGSFRKYLKVWRVNMKTITVMCLAGILLSACGTAQGDRGLSGAGIGAGIGVIGGPPGMVVGGVVGAGVGLLTTPTQVNLGRPAWKG